MKCEKCEAELKGAEKFCPDCGHEIKAVDPELTPEPAPDSESTTTEHQAADTPIEKMTKQLKEILPALINMKEFREGTNKSIEELREELKNLQGNILSMGKNIVQIGNRKIHVRKSGLSDEAKVDFMKFFSNVYRAKINGGTGPVSKIEEVQRKYKIDPKLNTKADLNEGTDAQGGYLVPEEFRDEIWRVADQASIILRNATVFEQQKGKTLPILTLASGVTTSWKNEAAASGQTDPTFGESTQDFKKMLNHTKISSELLEDEEVGLVDLIITLFGEAQGSEIDSQGIDGSGSPFTGILRTTGVNAVTMAATTFASVDFDDFSDAIALLPAISLVGAKWVLHRTILNVVRKLKDSQNNYLWTAPANGNPGTIWGYPYEVAEQSPALTDTAANKAFIYFGNMNKYLVATKGAMTVFISEVPLWENDQTVMQFRRRMAMLTALPAAFTVIKTAVS